MRACLCLRERQRPGSVVDPRGALLLLTPALRGGRAPAGLREVARRSIELYATVAATALRAAGLGEPAINPRAFVALFDGYGLHRIAGCDDQGLEEAVMALWAAATRAIGTR